MTIFGSELRAALRAEAAAHVPDREAMLDRITRAAMGSQFASGRSAPRVRITGAAVAVAAVLGGGGFAQWALAGDGEPRPAPPAPTVTATVSPSPSATPTTPSSSPAGTSAPPSRRPSKAVPPSPASPSGSPQRTDPAARGPIWSDGSVVPDGKTQGSSVVTVRTTERLTALEVTIEVARTPGLVSRGGSEQVPGASVTSTVIEQPGVLVHRFVLSSGDAVEPGTYTFSARYLFVEGGRDAGADTYGVEATSAGATSLTVSGDFR